MERADRAEATEPRATVAGVTASALLGAIAGYVDAVCLTRLFGVFPANQSGNAIALGVGIGRADWALAWRPAAAIGGFVAGVALAAAVRPRLPVAWRPRVLLGAELLGLAVVALVAGDVTAHAQVLEGTEAFVLLVLASIAMGVQTEVIRAHAGVSISTTYETGALVTLTETLTAHDGDGPRPSIRRAHHRAVLVLVLVIAGYVGGAALGARAALDVGAALAVPLLALVALLLTTGAWSPVGQGRSMA